MAEPAPVVSDLYSIVVIGAMNPRIHHPAWYRTIGAINDSEFHATVISQSIALSAMFSTFKIGETDIVILCQADRWEIKSPSPEQWDRMAGIAKLVFGKLNDTPVAFFGLTTQRHLPTASESVIKSLGAKLERIKLGLPTVGAEATNIQITSAEGDYLITVSVQQSIVNRQSVFILVNTQYNCPTTEPAMPLTQFDLGPLIDIQLKKHQDRAVSLFRKIVRGVEQTARK